MSKFIKTIHSERKKLADCIPLATPFTLNIMPTNYCDFKCRYCVHSLSKDEVTRQIGTNSHMRFDVFKKAIDGALAFSDKFKCILFAGYGEPLLNPELPKMIKYASSLNITEKIEVITNANTLSHDKSEELIEAGLTMLRVSVQGLSARKYKEISDVTIDFDQFIDQLTYFYNRKSDHCSVYVKIADIALEEGEKEKYYDLFDQISDFIAIEHIVDVFEGVDYNQFGRGLLKNKSGAAIEHVRICSFPFYTISVDRDGTIFNCHERGVSDIGNVENMTLFEAWNSKKTKEFWLDLLKDENKKEKCKKCKRPLGLMKEDVIDQKASVIANIIENMMQNEVKE